MRVLVTGATGFIGTHLVRRLVADGHAVRGLVRPGRAVDTLVTSGVEPVVGAMDDDGALTRGAQGCDVVFNLAVARPGNSRNRTSFQDLNVRGAEAAGRATLAAGCGRLVHTSSTGVYGRGRGPEIDESTPPRPESHYNACRLAAEGALDRLHVAEGLPLVVTRLSAVLGPGSDTWLGLFRAAKEPGFRSVGAGDVGLQVAWVTDVVDALVRAADVRGIEGERFVVSGADRRPLRDVLAHLRRIFGYDGEPPRLPGAPYRAVDSLGRALFRWTGREILPTKKYGIFLHDRPIDISKARRVLGWEPRVGLLRMVDEMAEHYRTSGKL